jgi:hypothetical protein
VDYNDGEDIQTIAVDESLNEWIATISAFRLKRIRSLFGVD